LLIFSNHEVLGLLEQDTIRQLWYAMSETAIAPPFDKTRFKDFINRLVLLD
jgi:hypothetical protein